MARILHDAAAYFKWWTKAIEIVMKRGK